MTSLNVSDTLNELIQKANTSFEQGKHYVVLAYEHALREGFTPEEAKRLLFERITAFSDRTIYRYLPDEAKDQKAVELALISRKNLPSLTSGNDSLESKQTLVWRVADINDKHTKLVSVCNDVNMKRKKVLGKLAAKMEKLYTLQGKPINTISQDIQRRMEQAGIKTAHHVPDYLEDKYKR